MSAICATDVCPVILNSTCVYYQGESLIYTGIIAGENLETALEKINAKFEDAGLGYVFTNGLIQPNPGDPVRLGGSLTQDTIIGGNYTLTFNGFLGASKFIKTGGLASQFLKADGSVDNTSYQPAGNYITSLTGDVLASGPGLANASLLTVNTNPGTYGSSTKVPTLTVDNKGRVTNVTLTTITVPSSSIILTGDVYGSGTIGTNIPITLSTVNSNVYGGNTLLKFGVDAKGRVNSAAPISALDINGVLGYNPVPDNRTITINGVSQSLSSNRTWNVGTVSSVSATNGAGISVSVTNPNTNPEINIVNTAPDRIVNLLSGAGIQITGSYPNFTIRALNPISTAGGELSGTYPNPILVNAAVIGKLLTGLNINGGTVQSTDDILTAFGKLQNQINGLIGGSIYQGTWNANTNTPTLTSSVGVKGHYYIVSVEGTTPLNDVDHWHVGDWAIFDGAEWQKVDNTDAVVSVNGYTGAVSITTQNVPEAVNLYFTTDRARNAVSAGVGLSYDNVTGVFTNTITQYTDALARQAISVTNVGNNGSASYDSGTGVINIPNYTLAGLGGVPTSTTISINGVTQDLSENRSWTIAAGVTSFNTRTGAITLTSGDITDTLGYTPYNATNPSGYISGITSGMVTTALGFTPYNDTNPAGYITGITSGMVTTALGYTPVTQARTLTINGTAYDLSADRSWTIASGVTSFNTRTGAITLTSGDVTGALGFTPYNATNPAGYITSSGSITGSAATLAMSSATITSSSWAGGAGYHGYSYSGGNWRFGFSSTGGVVDVYADGNFYATDNSYLVYHTNNISGASVAYAANAGELNGISAVLLYNNMGAAHSTRTSFDASTPSYGFGYRYVQGNTNGPGTGGGQFYSWYIGLGSDYPATGAGSYGAMFAVDRNASTPYLSVRYNENNSFGSWRRISAGYADSAAYVNQPTYNQPAVRVNASGTGSAGSSIAIQQITAEGWTGVFVDFEPNTGWGLYHDNPNNYFCVTAETTTGGLRSFTVPSRESGNRTAYEKIRFDQTNGSITAGGDITAFSDGRVKTEVKVIDNAIEKIKAIRGVTFLRIDAEGEYKDKRYAGVIAQEVLEVLPEVVNKDKNTGMYSVSYGNMGGLFIEGFKEHDQVIKAQGEQLKAQAEEIKELKRIINGFTN